MGVPSTAQQRQVMLCEAVPHGKAPGSSLESSLSATGTRVAMIQGWLKAGSRPWHQDPGDAVAVFLSCSWKKNRKLQTNELGETDSH